MSDHEQTPIEVRHAALQKGYKESLDEFDKLRSVLKNISMLALQAYMGPDWEPGQDAGFFWLCDPEATMGFYSSLELAKDAAQRHLEEILVGADPIVWEEVKYKYAQSGRPNWPAWSGDDHYSIMQVAELNRDDWLL